VRLKTLEFGYTLPSDWTSRINIASLRFHIGGMNLLTWSPDFKDYDPELEPKGDGYAGQGYPLQQVVTAGISIKF